LPFTTSAQFFHCVEGFLPWIMTNRYQLISIQLQIHLKILYRDQYVTYGIGVLGTFLNNLSIHLLLQGLFFLSAERNE